MNRHIALAAVLLAALTPAVAAAPNEDSNPVATADQSMTDVRTGTLSVDNDGTLNYRVPLELPEGRRGVRPDLALSYGSSRGNGLLGVGWRLEGLPAIGRMSFGNGVNFDGHDTYGFMPGFADPGVSPDNRLVAIGGGYLHTARETFRRFESYGTCGDGPCYFIMRDKRGMAYYFGGDAVTSVNHSYACTGGTCVSALNGPGGIRSWPLFKMLDLDGNYYQVDWRVLGGAIVPSNITYTMSTTPSFPWYYTVEFAYQARTDATPAPQSTSYRLSTLTVRAYGSEVHHYLLSYQTSPTTGRSRLTAAQKVGPAGELAPATSFTWQDGANGFEDSYVMHTVDASPSGYLQPGWESVTGDFNGDGYADLVLVNFAAGALKVACAKGGLAGLGPLVQHPGNGTAANTLPVGRPFQTRVGDFNADGRDDLVFASQDHGGRFLFQLSGGVTDACFGALDKSHTNAPGVDAQPARVFDADVNGDGFDDIIFVSMGPDPNLPVISPNPAITHFTVVGYLGGAGGLARSSSFAIARALPASVLQPTSDYVDFFTRGSGWDIFFSDFNGDGRSDLAAVYQGRGGRVVFEMDGKEVPAQMTIGGPGKTSPSGYEFAQGDEFHRDHQGSAYLEKEWAAFGGDVDGDGKSELVMPYNGPSNGVAPYSTDPSRPFGRQVMAAAGSPTGLVFGGNASAGWSSAEYTGLRLLAGLIFSGGTPYAGWNSFPCDVNGDRMTDLCMVYQGGDGRHLDWSLGTPTGPGPWVRTHPVTTPMADPAAVPGAPFQWSRWNVLGGDFNGDGATDVAFTYTGQAGCYLDYVMGTPSGFGTILAHSHIASANPTCQPLDGGGGSYFSDLSGDGRADGTRSTASSDGRWVSFAADINGDGKSDSVFVYHGAGGRFIKYLLARPGTPDILVGVGNGFGGTQTISYTAAARTSGVIQAGSAGAGLPNRDFRLLVSQVGQLNGRGRNLITSYSYQDGRVQPGFVRDRLDLGFRALTKTSTQTDVTETTGFNQAPPYHGTLASRSVARAIEGTGISFEWLVYEAVTPFPGTQQVRVTDRTTNYAENGTNTHTRYENLHYDAYGAPQTDLVCFNQACTTTTWIYNNIATATRYLVSQPAEQQVMSGTRVLDWQRFAYVPGNPALNHRLESVSRWLCADASQCTTTQAGARWVVVLGNRSYDSYGQVTAVWDALQHEVDTTYDSYSNIHPAVETRWVTSSGTRIALETERDYDPAGRLRYQIDRANHVTTAETRYDGLGRHLAVLTPDGSSTTYGYENWGDPNRQALYVETTEDAGRRTWKRAFFDGEGFTYREESKGDAGRVVVVTHGDDFVWDPVLGGVHRHDTSQPYWATVLPTATRRVDEEAQTRRPRRVSWLVGGATHAQQTYAYNGVMSGNAAEVRSVAMTDARGLTTTEYFDARDLMVRRVDANNGMMWPLYDDAGRQTMVALAGAPNPGVGLSTTYDSWGRVRGLQDPSLGATQQDFDDVGNVTRTVDGAGRVTTYTYDELKRMLTRVNADGTVTYHYDGSSPNGWGRLDRVTDVTGSTAFSYDAVGRVIAQTKTINGWTDPLTERLGYDLRGRLIHKELPDKTSIDYTYSDGGNLATVVVGGLTYATYLDHDASGRVLARRNRNGTTTSYSYGPEGYLTTLATLGPAASELQRLSYDYDLDWNVLTIADGRASKLMAKVNTDESQTYAYDSLNRLSQTTTSVFGPEQYEYDGLGNLTRKGNVRYSVTGHQATSGTDVVTAVPVFSALYDHAGSLLEKTQNGTVSDFEPDAAGRLRRVLSGGLLVQENSYDYAGARVKKIFHRPDGTTLTTYYVGGDYELRFDSASTKQWRTTRHIEAPGHGKLVSISSTQVIGVSALQLPSTLRFALAPTRAPSSGALALLGLVVIGGLASRRRLPLLLLLAACGGRGQPGGQQAQAVLTGNTTSGPGDGEVWYYANHLGSTSLVADSGGRAVSRIVYRPYGELVSSYSAGADAVTHKFTGKELDEETGLYDYGPRFYDPTLGRFTAPDSIVPDPRNAQAYNRYSYTLGNPVRYTDPSGHEAEPATGEKEEAEAPAEDAKAETTDKIEEKVEKDLADKRVELAANLAVPAKLALFATIRHVNNLEADAIASYRFVRDVRANPFWASSEKFYLGLARDNFDKWREIAEKTENFHGVAEGIFTGLEVAEVGYGIYRLAIATDPKEIDERQRELVSVSIGLLVEKGVGGWEGVLIGLTAKLIISHPDETRSVLQAIGDGQAAMAEGGGMNASF